MAESGFRNVSDAHAPASSLLSKRGMLRLAELQSLLGKEIRALSELHGRLVGALLACEKNVQFSMLAEYREQLHLIHTTVAKIRILLERVNDSELQQLGD